LNENFRLNCLALHRCPLFSANIAGSARAHFPTSTKRITEEACLCFAAFREVAVIHCINESGCESVGKGIRKFASPGELGQSRSAKGYFILF
jgi:hypothetical protein